MGRLGVCTSPNGVLNCKSSTCPGSSVNSNLAILRTGQLDVIQAKETWNAVASDLTQLLPHEQEELVSSLDEYEKASLEDTPVVNDSRLGDIYNDVYNVEGDMLNIQAAVDKDSKKLDPSYQYFNERNNEAIQNRINTNLSKIDALKAQLELLILSASKYEQVWEANGRWSRAFLVTNGNGHVHKTRSCSTCYPSTRFVWLPQYSGQSEELLVEDAGEQACTICFPSAPVDVLKRASRIDNPLTREERMQRKVDKEAKAVAAALKAISMPDGSVLKTEYSGVIRTERSASIEAVDTASFIYAIEEGGAYDTSQLNMPYIDKRRKDLENLIEALAFKHGVTVDEEKAAVREKAIKKFKKDYKN